MKAILRRYILESELTELEVSASLWAASHTMLFTMTGRLSIRILIHVAVAPVYAHVGDLRGDLHNHGREVGSPGDLQLRTAVLEPQGGSAKRRMSNQFCNFNGKNSGAGEVSLAVVQ